MIKARQEGRAAAKMSEETFVIRDGLKEETRPMTRQQKSTQTDQLSERRKAG